MNQGGGVYGSLDDALKAVIAKLGGAKLVAGRLWPEAVSDIDALGKAQQKLLNCLNPDRQEKLSTAEISAVLRMGREIDAWDVIEHLSGDLGFRFEPITREDLLRQQVIELRDLLKQATKIIQRSSVVIGDTTLDEGRKP